MAAAASIMPWSADDINAAIITCMSRWLQQRGNIDTAGELLREIERRRQMFAATVNDHFIRLSLKKRRLVPASAADRHKMKLQRDGKQKFDGYVRADGRILVTSEAWRRLWTGLDADAVTKYLLRAQLLLPGRDRVQSTEKINNKPGRFYVLAPAFISCVTV
jgi:hypothetical protein